MKQTATRALLFEVLDSVLHSWWTVVAGLCCGAAGAMIALHYLPKVYEAQAMIRVTPPKIPQEFVRATVTGDLTERLMSLRELVFREKYMEVVLERHFEAPADPARRESYGRLLRSKVEVEPAAGEGVFILSFRDNEAARAAGVVNTLTELCIEENARSRTVQASSLADTMRERLNEAQRNLRAKQGELSDFLMHHPTQTNESLGFNQSSLSQSRSDLERVIEKRSELEDELRSLRAERDALAVPSTATAPPVRASNPYAQQIKKLEIELEDLRSRYSDLHPDVIAKKNQIDDLRARAVEEPVESAPGGGPSRSPLDKEIDDLTARIARLDKDEERLNRAIGAYSRNIGATPTSDIQLRRLRDDETSLKEQVAQLDRQLRTAESGEQLEENQQGEQLEIIEPARVPRQPAEPQPLRVYLIGLALGMLLFVGPLPARRMLNPIIGSEAGLRALSDVPLLVSVPRVATDEYRGIQRWNIMKNVGLSLLSTAALMAITAYFGPTG